MKRTAPLDAQQLSLAFEAAGERPLPQPPEPGPARRRADGRRVVTVGCEVFDYRLRRARRRSIGFQIDAGGLTVSAPRWVALSEIETAIVEKQRWIRAKLAEWHDWHRKRRLHEMQFADGGLIPYLGKHLRLRLRAEFTGLRERGDARELCVALPAPAVESQVRDAVQAWLQTEARRVLGERIALLAPLETRLRGWALSSARSQWGSCTHDGRIRLNWRLIHFSVSVIDYVVAHELAHLAEMNHGARFWKTVGALLPGFEAARNEIKAVDLEALAF